MADESKDKWYQKTGDFINKLPSKSWYIARRMPGYVITLMGSRAYAFAFVASVISAGVAASAMWSLAIGASFLGVKTGIKIYDVMQTRKLEKEANLITEFATRLYHQEKILELVPELAPLKEKLSKIELNQDPDKRRAPITSNKAVNIFSNVVGMASKGYGIYKIAKNPTAYKVSIQSIAILKQLNAESPGDEPAYQRFLHGLANDPEEREKLIEFINKYRVLEGGYNYDNLQKLEEQIQKMKNENQALLDVNKDISYKEMGKLSAEELTVKFDERLKDIKADSKPPTQETGFQSLMHGIKGAFNPYNPYIIVKDQEAEQNVDVSDSKIKKKALDDTYMSTPDKEELKGKALLVQEQQINKTTTQKIWSGVSYGLESIDKVVDLIFPDEAPNRKVKHSGLTLDARSAKKEKTTELHSLSDALIDRPVPKIVKKKVEKKKKTTPNLPKDTSLSVDSNAFNEAERLKAEKKLQRTIKRIGRAHKAPESEIKKETHKEKVTSSRQKDSKKQNIEVSGAPVPRRDKKKSSKKRDNKGLRSPGDLDWVGRSQLKTSGLGRGKSG